MSVEMNGYAGHRPDYNGVINHGQKFVERMKPMGYALASAVIGLGLAVQGVLSTLHGNMKPDPAAHAVVSSIQRSHNDVTSAYIEPVNGPGSAPAVELVAEAPKAAPPQQINRSRPKPSGNTPG